MEIKTIGALISRARINKKMSTIDLAEKINKSQATVSRIENGKQGINLPLLSRIAKILDVHPFALMGKAGVDLEGGRNGKMLCKMLLGGRMRSKLSVAEVSGILGVDEEAVESFERGDSLPDEMQFEQLCSIYPIDAKVAMQMYTTDMHCPQLSDIMSSMNLVLGECQDLLRELPRDKPEVIRLAKHVEEVVDYAGVAERKGGYFSLGHVSDDVLAALQDCSFHAEVEMMAKEWRNAQNKEYELSEDMSRADCVEC